MQMKDIDVEDLDYKKFVSRELVNFKQDQRLLNVILPPNHNIFHKFIINPDAKWKTLFDILILILVAYSCITTILFITFPIERSDIFEIIFFFVETFFYIDFILNWFQGYEDIQEHKFICEFGKIAQRYLRGWFTIDFIAIFPF